MAVDEVELIQLLRPEDRVALVAALRNQLSPEVLSYLDEAVRSEVIERLVPVAAATAVARLEVDDVVDVLSGLKADEQLALLRALPELEREAVEQGLAYPEDSAGRLMQRVVVAIPEYSTVGHEARAHVVLGRGHRRDAPASTACTRRSRKSTRIRSCHPWLASSIQQTVRITATARCESPNRFR